MKTTLLNNLERRSSTSPALGETTSPNTSGNNHDNHQGLSREQHPQPTPESLEVSESVQAMDDRKRLANNLSNGCYWLSTNNPKTIKGVLDNYITAVLSFAPANYSDHTTCFRFKHCKDTCLYHQGRGRFDNVSKARIKKTNLFFDNQEQAAADIHNEIVKMQKKLSKGINTPHLAVRLNCFSDIKWEEKTFGSIGDKTIIDANPQVQFYDYTKIPYKYRLAWREMPLNYHLTYSFDGTDEDIPNCLELLHKGHNVAVVYTKEHYKHLLSSDEELNHPWGYPMYDNEITDNRFLDPSPAVMFGREKGTSNIAI